MKCLLVIAALAVLVVHGEKPKPQSDTDKQTAGTKNKQTKDAAARPVVVINQQAPQEQKDGHPAQPPSYLHELLLPQNLPNLALAIIGIAGIERPSARSKY
jgi:hypothetical protein